MVARVIGRKMDPDDRDDPTPDSDPALFEAGQLKSPPIRPSKEPFDHEVYNRGDKPRPLRPDPLEIINHRREANAGSA